MIRYKPEYQIGLKEDQIKQRKEENLINHDMTLPTKSMKAILLTNFVTIFNLMNIALAVIVFLVGSYKNMLFIGLVLLNTAISTIQEIHSKRVVDRLSVIASKKVSAIRGGQQTEIGINEIVLDDVLLGGPGNQIVVDSIVLEGEIEVNESFITGEQDAVVKKKGEMLLSGSFIVSGSCHMQVEHIGMDNYTSQITKEARYVKKVKSEIMNSLNQIIKVVSIAIVPVGILLFLNQIGLAGNTLKLAVVNTVAALIGMIPEGLVLLTSTVLAVSVIRLARKKVLVQDLYCIETLARVDTLCLDKTGTLTEGKLEVKQMIPLGENTKEELEVALKRFSRYSKDNNSTMEAIHQIFEINITAKVDHRVAFSSDRKWSGLTFQEEGTYLLGAPEIVLQDEFSKYEEQIVQYSKEYRVIVLASSSESLQEKELPKQIEAVGLILITDKVRKDAKKTLSYFKEQGVAIKIISGDNPITVAKVAKQTGVEYCEKYVDCSTLKSKEEIEQAAKEYTIFGRVSPIQKKELICAMKKQGHTVAMTGDGVNDVIALKEADCSIAMASGSDAARSVSQLVLLDSNFGSMPPIVAEGRRTINNIQRSASLFLSKTVYATILAIIFVFTNMPYPFMPIQLSLIALVCIGTPSFLLALEPNKERIKGKFMANVLTKSVPASLTVVVNIAIVTLVSYLLHIPTPIYSTLCVIATVLIGFMLLFKISRPLNLYRGTLLFSMIGIFVFCAIMLKDLFSFAIDPKYLLLSALLAFVSVGLFMAFNTLTKSFVKRRVKLK